ncbi:MAG TPA: cytochrome P460 family protein [Bryobacteraceae bacterium]|nr:cytochrome P460 family protein [Bryobacteraceae bacterium]
MRVILFLTVCLVAGAILLGGSKPENRARPAVAEPVYTNDGQLRPPLDYREWIYLTSGLDMSYTPRVAGMAGHSMFDNVFVNPEAYRAFLQTGTWPDKTMLVLEIRGAESNASINKAGHFQSESLMGVELHVKDAAHGGWAFYELDGAAPAKMVPKEASCYSCHRDHGAVDTTFVQFYPTLFPLAKQKSTLSGGYVHETGQRPQ